MARANQAYKAAAIPKPCSVCLTITAQINAFIAGEGAAAELLRIARQIRHAERDIATLDAEWRILISSENLANCTWTPKPPPSSTATFSPSWPPALREQVAPMRGTDSNSSTARSKPM